MWKLIPFFDRWLLCCLFFFGVHCKQATKKPSGGQNDNDKIQQAITNILSVEQFIQDGDIITRTGMDFTSESLRNLNRRNKTYSHCGIASIEHDTVFVYHALGGEWNPDQKIRRDPLVIFCDPYNNKGYGIYRFKSSIETQKKIKNSAYRLYLQGISFDMKFDLNTDNKMYCAEYVYKAVKNATNNEISFPHSNINHFEFIGVDDIFLHPRCINLYEKKFN